MTTESQDNRTIEYRIECVEREIAQIKRDFRELFYPVLNQLMVFLQNNYNEECFILKEKETKCQEKI